MKLPLIVLIFLLGSCQCLKLRDKKYSIPPLTPFKVPKVTIQTSNNLKVVVNNVEVYGIDTVKVKDLMFDFDKNVIKISLLIDHLTILSQYEIDGRLIVPLQGSGPSNITTLNSVIDYQINFSIFQRDGKEYMNIEKDTVTLKSENIHYQLDNLFGDQQLSDEANKILNEHSKEIANELREPISETMDEIFLKE